MASAEDRELARESQLGDTRAFTTLVERYYKVLFNIALRMVNDYEDARDITQATFLKAYSKLDTYDPKHKFFSWIYRITVNESLNLLGRRKPHELLDHDLASTQRNPEEEYEKQRVGAAIQTALMRLTPQQRQVVILRHFQALSYREMSSVLGIPEKTVKSRLYSARRELCAILLHRSAAT